MAISVLLVEKDVRTSDLLAPSLAEKGYRVTVARSQRQALSHSHPARPDLLVLDVPSFGANGYKVWEAVRSRLGNVPAILLLEKGHAAVGGAAESFMERPFTPRKLLHRIDKLAEELDPRHISLGPLVLDPESRALRCGERTVPLRPKEAELLAFFMRHPGKTLSRQEIMRAVWDSEFEEDTRTLSVHVCWLRRKVERDPSAPRLLQTVRGVGYRFDVPEA
jgi:DNA-binding response OmpR family regulator